jgi:bacteriocin biosynthesis cyclodehydratase domain-containing protein
VHVDDLHREAARHGSVSVAEFTALIASLVAAGVAQTAAERPGGRAASIRVHGRGPISDLLVDALQHTGIRVTHSSAPHAVVRPELTDLAVLSDYLVADPRLVRDLHDAGVPHLLVRVRDGTGLVGPMVLPGKTSCLGCADLHRSDRDAAWPALAAQLRDTVGIADRSTVMATVALALGQVQMVVRAVRTVRSEPGGRLDPPAPATLSATLEFDVRAGSIATRRWPRHPLCPCADI